MKKMLCCILVCLLAALAFGALCENEKAVHSMETKLLEPFGPGERADGTQLPFGDDSYFTLVFSEKTKVDESIKTWSDGYSSSQRVNFGGKMTKDRNHIRFTITHPWAEVAIWWVEGGDNNRQIGIWAEDGTVIAKTDETLEKNQPCLSVITLSGEGTYLLGGATANNYIFKLTVTEYDEQPESTVPERAAWDTVPAPVISGLKQNGAEIVFSAQAPVGTDGADSIRVTVSSAGRELCTLESAVQGEESQHFTYMPAASGEYTFTARAVRKGEKDITGGSAACAFVLPLASPVLSVEEDRGHGSVLIGWNEVPEAQYYAVYVNGQPMLDGLNATQAVLDGLETGKEHSLAVQACRTDGGPSTVSDPLRYTPNEEPAPLWNTRAFGSSVKAADNGSVKNADGSVTVFSESGRGKIVPASTDGLCFYFTRVRVKENNFVLTGHIHVDSWTFSNGQEGFGIAALDRVGINGSQDAFWNNSIMGLCSKVEYREDGAKITMKLGIGALARLGVTAKDIADFSASGTFIKADGSSATLPESFISEMTALEKSCLASGKGTYNIIGNFTGNSPMGDRGVQDICDLNFTLTRDNTGWRVKYTSDSGLYSMEKLYRDEDRTALTALDSEYAYIGFFAARNARITVSDISLTFSSPAEDAPAEQEKTTLVPVTAAVESAAVSNSGSYPFVFLANADGSISIKTEEGDVLYGPFRVQANEKLRETLSIPEGKLTAEAVFTPDQGYIPAENALLASYNSISLPFSVEYRAISGDTLYISPRGTARGDGSADKPLDLQTALSFAVPGQRLLLAEGTYSLFSSVTVPRYHDGTEQLPIILEPADPEAPRPVLDFKNAGGGFTLGGSWWRLSGFDITRTAPGSKGLQISGNNNLVYDIRAYRNGNTGIQISRFRESDLNDEWPACNTVRACMSYMNADPGYEDADGFAAKLTCGEGNLFTNCISAFNADDGWDLYAKAETGCIGSVTVDRCVSFMNGYAFSADGSLIRGGNGNGFKLGGESLPGGHLLKGSLAFRNAGKGIDSNSCPDITVAECISLDNGAANVALYTNSAANTAFTVQGILSLRSVPGTEDNLKPKGTQELSSLLSSGNYWCDGSTSENAEGLVCSLSGFRASDTERIISAFLSFADSGVTDTANGIYIDENGTLCLNGFMEMK